MKPLVALSCAALLSVLAAAPAVADEEMSAFHRDLLANLEGTAKKLIDLAEATPENMFSWRPNKDVRSVSEVYIHVVGANMFMPAALGAAPPEGIEIPENAFALMQEWEATITSKADVVAKLKESFEYVKAALASIEDLETEVTLFGPPQPKRAYFFILQGHAHEHLGQSIAYARSFGVAPPWSRQQPAGDGDGDGDGDSGGR